MLFFVQDFLELIERVAQGERTTITCYKNPIAEIGPSSKGEKPVPKFGTGKGKVVLLDPRALEPMTDEEVEAFIEGRD